MVCANSSSTGSASVFELSTRSITPCCDGSTFWYDGGAGICGGSRVLAIVDCTSCAAASMLRFKSNCSVIRVSPCWLDEVIELRPEIAANCFSSGSAIDEAIVSGLAPGSEAWTEITGKVDVGQIADRQLAIGHRAEHQPCPA